VSLRLRQEIKELLVRELDLAGVEPAAIDDDAPLFGPGHAGPGHAGGGLGLDSLDALQLAMAVEERFGVAVPDGEGGKTAFASVSALAAWVTTNRTP